MNSDIAFLRHALATLAYRGGKVLRTLDSDSAAFRPAPGSRTAVEILAHVGDLMVWGTGQVSGKQDWHDSQPLAWPEECGRFFRSLRAFDDALAGAERLVCPAKRIFQGPIADALTHIGQMGMLARMAGRPVRGENYFRAGIETGQTGPEQPPPVREFD